MVPDFNHVLCVYMSSVNLIAPRAGSRLRFRLVVQYRTSSSFQASDIICVLNAQIYSKCWSSVVLPCGCRQAPGPREFTEALSDTGAQYTTCEGKHRKETGNGEKKKIAPMVKCSLTNTLLRARIARTLKRLHPLDNYKRNAEQEY